jgi:hypothetical protein
MSKFHDESPRLKELLKEVKPVLPAVTTVLSEEKDKIICDICDKDRQFFTLNPHVDEFNRDLVKGEEGEIFDFPLSTRVRVCRGDQPGTRWRKFYMSTRASFDDRKKFAAELKRVNLTGGCPCVIDVDPDAIKGR